jgi:hypothetical protein
MGIAFPKIWALAFTSWLGLVRFARVSTFASHSGLFDIKRRIIDIQRHDWALCDIRLLLPNVRLRNIHDIGNLVMTALIPTFVSPTFPGRLIW